MRTLLRFTVAAILFIGVFGFAPQAMAATTAEQLVALSRAGLDDEILIALIETDGSRFVLKAEDILELYRKGLSNRVIRAMQATARKPQTPPPARDARVAPTPSEFVDNTQAVPPQAEPPVPAAPRPDPPTAVTVRAPDVHVSQHVTQHVEVEAPRERSRVETTYVAVPVYVQAPVVAKPDPPVYWGWGGQRRPDSWDDGQKTPAKEKPRERE